MKLEKQLHPQKAIQRVRQKLQKIVVLLLLGTHSIRGGVHSVGVELKNILIESFMLFKLASRKCICRQWTYRTAPTLPTTNQPLPPKTMGLCPALLIRN